MIPFVSRIAALVSRMVRGLVRRIRSRFDPYEYGTVTIHGMMSKTTHVEPARREKATGFVEIRMKDCWWLAHMDHWDSFTPNKSSSRDSAAAGES